MPFEPTSGESEGEILQRLAAIERRISDVQAMAARGYERSFDWPGEVAAMREEPSYPDAFDGEPLVTVRIATHNLSDVLCERALASLRRQTYTRWEAVVVGDQCTDDTEERVKAIGDPRIRFVNLPYRAALPEGGRARWYVTGVRPYNLGLEQARGQWVAMLDHDDEWEPFHLETLVETAQRERVEVVYARIRIIDVATGQTSEMGRWPPERGQFGFLAALQHAGLRRFRYDANCRFADEPGDWNLARRLWDAGVHFRFVDRITAIHHFVPRFDDPTTEQRMIAELRGWARDLEEARDWWRARAEENAAAAEEARAEVALLREQASRAGGPERWPRARRRKPSSPEAGAA